MNIERVFVLVLFLVVLIPFAMFSQAPNSDKYERFFERDSVNIGAGIELPFIKTIIFASIFSVEYSAWGANIQLEWLHNHRALTLRYRFQIMDSFKQFVYLEPGIRWYNKRAWFTGLGLGFGLYDQLEQYFPGDGQIIFHAYANLEFGKKFLFSEKNNFFIEPRILFSQSFYQRGFELKDIHHSFILILPELQLNFGWNL